MIPWRQINCEVIVQYFQANQKELQWLENISQTHGVESAIILHDLKYLESTEKILCYLRSFKNKKSLLINLEHLSSLPEAEFLQKFVFQNDSSIQTILLPSLQKDELLIMNHLDQVQKIREISHLGFINQLKPLTLGSPHRT